MTTLRTAAIIWICLLIAGPATAGALYWDWPAGHDFAGVEHEGTTVDAEGRLTVGLAAAAHDLEGAEVAWCVAPLAGGGFAVGTGHSGTVHRFGRDGNASVWAELDATQVLSLLDLGDGTVLAGTGPDGTLYRIGADGSAAEVGQVAGSYVWSMARDGGDVWLATGSPAAVARWSVDEGTLAELVQLPAENALDVAVDGDGSLLVSTQGPGLVYRLAGTREPRLIGQCRQDEARRLIAGPQGHWHVLALNSGDGEDLAAGAAMAGGGNGTAASRPRVVRPVMPAAEAVPASALLRIAEEGLSEVWRGDLKLLAATWHPRWGWLAGGPVAEDGGGSRLQRLSPPAGHRTAAAWNGGDVLDLAVLPDEDPGPLAVVQANPAGVALVTAPGDAVAAIGPPLDAGAAAQWGRLSWTGDAGSGRVRWSVRTGRRAEPDETWSAWSDSWSDHDGELDVPEDRYLQWRVEMPVGDTPPVVTAVSVSAWRENRAPVIETFTREYLGELGDAGLLNGGDSEVHVFRSGLQAEFNRQLPARRWTGVRRHLGGRAVQVFSWQTVDPDGDNLDHRLDFRPLGQEVWRRVPTEATGDYPFPGGIGSWDTADVPDGLYEVRLTTSDAADQGGDALTAERRLGPVRVDNTPPVLDRLRLERTADGFRLTFAAADDGTPLAAARVRLPDGSHRPLAPRDRICDSAREEFATEVAWPTAGAGEAPWAVRVEVMDLHGNVAHADGEVR